jgi:hypothetical protein
MRFRLSVPSLMRDVERLLWGAVTGRFGSIFPVDRLLSGAG